ncbi:MAG: hypothetical protein GXP42_04490 [Chloroflexi bacterium]|nr:hypothetical protein [Chloroflexota bacterium]
MNATSSDMKPAHLLTNVVDMIAAPGEALQRISEVNRRSWWFPAILCLAAAVLYLYVSLDYAVAEAQKQAELQLGAMPPDQVEAARPFVERFTSRAFIFGSGAVTVVVGLLASWGFAVAIFYFGAALAGPNVPLARLWPVTVWTWFPFALRGFLQSAWTLVSGKPILYPGLSFFVASGDTMADQANPLFVAASYIDLFTLWHLLLVYLLFRVVARLGALGSMTLTFIYGVIGLGLRVLPALAAGAFSP